MAATTMQYSRTKRATTVSRGAKDVVPYSTMGSGGSYGSNQICANYSAGTELRRPM